MSEELTLTLTPEMDAAEAQAAAAAEEKKPEVDPVVVDESMLTEAERKMVDEFSKKIDVTDTNQVMQYGSAAQKNIAAFSENALNSVKTKDLGEVGKALADLVVELKTLDDEESKGLFGFFQKKKKDLASLKASYSKAETNVDNIVKVLEGHQIVLMKDIAMFDQMYELNTKYYKELTMYIIAGKKRLASLQANELEQLRKKAEETGAHVHVCHISTAKSVDIVRRMKKRGVKITCETCPQYFTLTEDEVLSKGALAKINPPLRTAQDVQGILAGLKDGTIDAIATDHAPHSEEEKSRPLVQAPSGAVGLETSLALSLTALYHTKQLTLPEVIRRMSTNPADILHLPKGRMSIGMDADLVIFDPDEQWVVDPAKFASKGRNTPFGGCKVRGKVKYTIVGGEVIYEEK